MAEKLLALQNSIEKLEKKVSSLLADIETINNKVSENNIKENSEKLLQLETELKVTQQALVNRKTELAEFEQFQKSEKYQALLLELEKQKLEAIKKTKEFYKNLVKLQAEAEAVMEMAKKYDRLNIQAGKFNGWSLRTLQPFSWLNMVMNDIRKRLNDTKWLNEKLG